MFELTSRLSTVFLRDRVHVRVMVQVGIRRTETDQNACGKRFVIYTTTIKQDRRIVLIC
jgi:hypothetical protein